MAFDKSQTTLVSLKNFPKRFTFRRLSRTPSPPPPSPTAKEDDREPMSTTSSHAVPDVGWSSQNFMLGAGMFIIQPSTHLVVLLYDTEYKYWFLPRGRRDIGETLEETAIREAYEESGYRVTPLPLYSSTHAPTPTPSSVHSPPGSHNFRIPRLNAEPLFTTLTKWQAGNAETGTVPCEYMCYWYAGQIPHDAVVDKGNSVQVDEQAYTTHLCTYEQAIERLTDYQLVFAKYVWAAYQNTLRIQSEEKEKEEKA